MGKKLTRIFPARTQFCWENARRLRQDNIFRDRHTCFPSVSFASKYFAVRLLGAQLHACKSWENVFTSNCSRVFARNEPCLRRYTVLCLVRWGGIISIAYVPNSWSSNDDYVETGWESWARSHDDKRGRWINEEIDKWQHAEGGKEESQYVMDPSAVERSELTLCHFPSSVNSVCVQCRSAPSCQRPSLVSSVGA